MKKFFGVAVVGAALLLAGCGGDSGGDSEEDQVRETVSSFSAAIADGDFASLCGMYTEETNEFFEESAKVAGDCEVLLEGTYGSLDEETVEALGEVDSIEIKGEKATLTLGTGDPMVLEKVDGEWKLTLD